MSILSQKYLPFFLGFATLTWIIGGTMWFNNQFCEVPSTNVVPQHIDSIKFKPIAKTTAYFQALNVFFQNNKYQFADNVELNKYFYDLHDYLTMHPNVKLKITAHQDNTEGVGSSKKRLTFMRLFLENHGFLPNQFEFEDVKNKKPFATIDNIKNRRLEIRLIIP